MTEENNKTQNSVEEELKKATEGLSEVKSESESDGDEEPDSAIDLEQKLKEQEDKNLRLLAEMQNMRNRHQKDMREAREFAVTSFAQDMIHVLENLNRAKESIPEEDNQVFKNILEGLNLTREEVIRIFGKHGIERVAPEPGEDFDYKYHQAVVQIPTEEYNAGQVVQLIHAGYIMKDRILKPAMVGVAKKPENNFSDNSDASYDSQASGNESSSEDNNKAVND